MLYNLKVFLKLVNLLFKKFYKDNGLESNYDSNATFQVYHLKKFSVYVTNDVECKDNSFHLNHYFEEATKVIVHILVFLYSFIAVTIVFCYFHLGFFNLLQNNNTRIKISYSFNSLLVKDSP